jgi:hypothetical protein
LEPLELDVEPVSPELGEPEEESPLLDVDPLLDPLELELEPEPELELDPPEDFFSPGALGPAAGTGTALLALLTFCAEPCSPPSSPPRAPPATKPTAPTTTRTTTATINARIVQPPPRGYPAAASSLRARVTRARARPTASRAELTPLELRDLAAFE